MINKAVSAFSEHCVQLKKELRDTENMANKLSRLLEETYWEEDMLVHEKIEFCGTTREFITLILPFLQNRHWHVNGSHSLEACLRVLDELIVIRPGNREEKLRFSSLLDAYNRFLSDND